MTDIALDYTGQTGDLDLTGHRLNLITGTAAIEQQLRFRCRYFEGEWFLDERQGIPFLRAVLIKNPDLQLIEHLFRAATRTTPGIRLVTNVEISLDVTTRTLTVRIAATMDTGEPVVFQPFIVEI